MLKSTPLEYAYEPGHPLHFPAVHCAKGEHWLLLGQSGSGKTTLLHLLGGLLSPRNGSIVIAGQDITKMSAGALDKFRGQHIGIIFQQSHFVRSLTVVENLLLAQKLAGAKVDLERCRQLLGQLHLADKENKKPDRLSVGEQQRVAIARAIINRPDVILADEPTAALDDVNCQEVIRLLEAEARQVGATLLVVTHDGRLKDHFDQQILLETV